MNMLLIQRCVVVTAIMKALTFTTSECTELHVLPVIEFQPYLWDDGSYLLFDDGSTIGV